MNETKKLDLSKLTDLEIDAIKNGFYKFMNGDGIRFFGGISNKAELKEINRIFGYTNKKTFITGIVLGFGCSFVSRKIKSIRSNPDISSLSALKTFLGIHPSSEEPNEDCKGD